MLAGLRRSCLLLPVQGGRRVLPWWLRLRVAAQVSAAVAYLHGLPASAGGPLVHRDIKPANWFLDGRLNAKLGDMGLALPLADAEAASRRRGGAGDREQAMVGTWQYMPPEYR
jgi:serine/threonine protein kinase